MKNKLELKRETAFLYISIILVLEVIVFLLLKDSGAIFSLLAAMVLIPVAMVMIIIMFSSLEMAIIISLFAIPILPITGYVMLRIGILDYQYIVYIIFYLTSAAAMIKNNLLKNIDKSKFIMKNKGIRILILIFVVINIIFAYDKQLTFMIVTLSFLPFSIYMYIVKTLVVESRKSFLDKVIYTICLSISIASIPDIIFFVLNWIDGNMGLRGYGPLTGNYILIFVLIALVISLTKWVKEKNLKNKWLILVILLFCIIITQVSRGGFFSFIAIMVAFLAFNIKNWKKYLPIFLIGVSFLSYNVNNRNEVAIDSNINEIKEILIDKKMEPTSADTNELISRVLNSQSALRQVIWKATINISVDYPYFGVGLGNLKYFFNDYTSGKKGYTDAHNLFLNMSSELGFPFMILNLILLIYIAISELIKYFKTKDYKMKLNRLSIVIICGTIFLYGNLTGIPLQLTTEVYSFNAIFIFMILLTYRDCIEEIE